MASVLVVDDEKLIVKGMRFSLEQDGMEVDCAYDGEEAIGLAKQKEYDVVLLDVMLPKFDGYEVCQAIREFSEMPIIMLTARDSESDQVIGLEMGADDYISKPFSLMVLRARVNTQLRKKQVNQSEIMKIGPFAFDFVNMRYEKNGMAIELSKTEQKLLRILTENKGITLSRANLVDRIWTDGAEFVDENALSVTVKRLRDKLEDKEDKVQYIKTVYGIGYTWVL